MPNSEDQDTTEKRDQNEDVRFPEDKTSPEMANDSNVSPSKKVTEQIIFFPFILS